MLHEHLPAPPGCGTPLSEAELEVIRATLKELKGAARVWDVLALERLTHRRYTGASANLATFSQGR